MHINQSKSVAAERTTSTRTVGGVEPTLNGAHSGGANVESQPRAKEIDQTTGPAHSEARAGRSLAQILIILVVLLALVNIPINDFGLGLAHLETETRPIIIKDGMVFKGSGPELYVLEDHKLRLISSPAASGRYFRLHNVRTVEDSTLEQFGQGISVHHLIKCREKPEVYALDIENGRQKRLVQQPPVNSTRPWDRVHTVSCKYLRNLPDGPPITADREASTP